MCSDSCRNKYYYKLLRSRLTKTLGFCNDFDLKLCLNVKIVENISMKHSGRPRVGTYLFKLNYFFFSYIYILYYVLNDNCTKILLNNKYFYSERLLLNTYTYTVL